MRNHLKIAMVAPCPFPYRRGTPIRIFRMAEALSNLGHDVNVITYHLGENGDRFPFKIHRIREIKSYTKYSPGPTYKKLAMLDPLLAIKLYRFSKQNEVDIIHAHNYEGLLIALLLKNKINRPVIYDAHTLLESELPYYKLGLSKKIERLTGIFLDRWLPKKADHIITVTDRIKNKLISNSAVIPKNITTIMNGVEEKHFDVIEKDQKQIPNKKQTLIFTGNMAPYQGVDLLLRIFQQVLNERPDVRLLIVSDSSFEYYEPLAKALNIRNRIDLINADFNSLPKYLAQASVAINPRIDCDGFPQKLLNYMAAGKPIVSFESSGSNLIHGTTGLVVEDGNIPAFAKCVIQLLNNTALAQILGRNAKEIITSEYTWKDSAKKVEAVYKQVLTLRAIKRNALTHGTVSIKT